MLSYSFPSCCNMKCHNNQSLGCLYLWVSFVSYAPYLLICIFDLAHYRINLLCSVEILKQKTLRSFHLKDQSQLVVLSSKNNTVSSLFMLSHIKFVQRSSLKLCFKVKLYSRRAK